MNEFVVNFKFFVNNAGTMASDSIVKRKELLIGLLKDPASEVSSAAAAALEQLEGVLGVDAVLEQLKKGTLAEKVRAIYALGEIGGEKVLTPIVYCASRPEEDLKAAAIDVLGKLALRSTIPTLIEKLKDDNSGIRAKAIKALGNFREKSIMPHLLPFLDAGDGLTDIEAALALAKIGDPSLEAPLMKLALSPLAPTRAAAATALGLLRPA
jgi:HEAT repeat protein